MKGPGISIDPRKRMNPARDAAIPGFMSSFGSNLPSRPPESIAIPAEKRRMLKIRLKSAT